MLEPLTATYEDAVTRWNMLYPLARKKPNARYIGEVYKAESTKAVREALEPQNIRFAYPGDTVSPFYAMKHLTFTFMSDFTYNRVGYVDVDLDDLDQLGLGEPFSLTTVEREKLDRADALQEAHGIKGLVLGVDHAATRILAGDREHALLEYLTVVPYYFWGAYNIHEMNSSTNVTRHPDMRSRMNSGPSSFCCTPLISDTSIRVKALLSTTFPACKRLPGKLPSAKCAISCAP